MKVYHRYLRISMEPSQHYCILGRNFPTCLAGIKLTPCFQPLIWPYTIAAVLWMISCKICQKVVGNSFHYCSNTFSRCMEVNMLRQMICYQEARYHCLT